VSSNPEITPNFNPTPHGNSAGQLPVADVAIRFGCAVLESVLAIFTLGMGWFIWWLVLVGQGLTPARQILKLRVIDINTKLPVTPGQAFVRGFVLYFIAFSVGTFIINMIVIGLGTFAMLVSALLVFRSSRQTLWDQMTNTTLGRF
jgi:hypothetical protein